MQRTKYGRGGLAAVLFALVLILGTVIVPAQADDSVIETPAPSTAVPTALPTAEPAPTESSVPAEPTAVASDPAPTVAEPSVQPSTKTAASEPETVETEPSKAPADLGERAFERRAAGASEQPATDSTGTSDGPVSATRARARALMAPMAVADVSFGALETRMNGHFGWSSWNGGSNSSATSDCYGFGIRSNTSSSITAFNTGGSNGTAGAAWANGNTAWVGNGTTAYSSHGYDAQAGCIPLGEVHLGQQSALGFSVSNSTSVAPGTIFNLGRMVHVNNPVQTTNRYFQGNLDLRFNSRDLSFRWRMNETPNTNGDERDNDILDFMNVADASGEFIGSDGLTYNLVVIGFTNTNGSGNTCNATLPNLGSVQDQFITREGQSTYGCLYASIEQKRSLEIVKSIDPSVPTGTTIPNFSFTSDSNLSASPWNDNFSLRPASVGVTATTGRKTLYSTEQVTIQETGLSGGWQVKELSCVDGLNQAVGATSVANGTITLSGVGLAGSAEAAPITCRVVNTLPTVSVQVAKNWVVNGTIYAHGNQPEGLTASLILDPQGQPAGAPQFGQARSGFTLNQNVTINESAAVNATLLPGCTLTSRTISGPGISGSVALPSGGYTARLTATTNSYTLTNTVQCQTLTLNKQTLNAMGGTLTGADWNGGLFARNASSNLTFNHGQQRYVASGSYTLTEADLPGYARTSLSCTGGTLTNNVVQVAAGSNVVCTFYNASQPGGVSWTKIDGANSQPLGGSQWKIVGPGHPAPGTTFPDCIAGSAAACTGLDKNPAAGQFSLGQLFWGEYTVTETNAPSGYTGNQEFSFSVTASNAGTVVNRGPFANDRIYGKVSWEKIDETSSQLIGGSKWTITGPGFEAGATFEDCVEDQASDCTGMDKDPAAGKFLLEQLAWGDYAVEEVEPPAGYEGSASFVFTVNAANSSTTIEKGQFGNDRLPGSVVWAKTDAETGNLIAGSVWTITRPAGAEPLTVNDCVAGSAAACTGPDRDPAAGKFLVEDLVWGSYTATETTPPPGYTGSGSFEFVITAEQVSTPHNGGTITNEQIKGTVVWAKIAATSEALLQGSEWSLTGPLGESGASDTVSITDCAQTPCGSGPFADQDPAPGEFSIEGLPWGEYTLVETKAPPGYQLSAEEHSFVVGPGDPAQLEWDLGSIVNELRDGVTIPLTGGIGREHIYIAGALLVLLAAAAYGAKRFRGRHVRGNA